MCKIICEYCEGEGFYWEETGLDYPTHTRGADCTVCAGTGKHTLIEWLRLKFFDWFYSTRLGDRILEREYKQHFKEEQ